MKSKLKIKSKLIFLVLAFSIFFSCEKDSSVTIEKGTVVFSESLETLKNATTDFESVTHAIITIIDENNNIVVDGEKIELYKFDNKILTYPIELNVGAFNLTEFYLVDADNNILFMAPKDGSEMAQYVVNPLAISFNITADEETKKTIELLSIEESNPSAFGYAEFDADIVETFEIFVSIFEYDSTNNMFQLTDGILNVLATDFNLVDTMEAINNVVKLKDGIDNYQVIFTKNGTEYFNQTFTNAELKAYEISNINPLKIFLEGQATIQTLVLQPGEEGKDAWIGNYFDYLDRNFGDNEELTGLAWTAGGAETTARGLIDFDISSLPKDIIIVDAKLTLFAIDNTGNSTTNNDGHSQLSGSNACGLFKITSDWEESTVTWNNQPSISIEDSITLSASTYNLQDYVINVTEYINDAYNFPSDFYGFLIKLQSEQYYRRLIFGSSDNRDASKHPKLEIKYII